MTIAEAQDQVGKYIFNTITFSGPIGFAPEGDRWLVKHASDNHVVLVHAPLHGRSAGQMTLTQGDLDHFTTSEPPGLA
jgi:hypothetical protein